MKDVEKRFYATDIADDDKVAYDLLVKRLTLPVTVTVVQLMTKEQTQPVRDMKRLEINCSSFIVIERKLLKQEKATKNSKTTTNKQITQKNNKTHEIIQPQKVQCGKIFEKK